MEKFLAVRKYGERKDMATKMIRNITTNPAPSRRADDFSRDWKDCWGEVGAAATGSLILHLRQLH